MAANAVAVVVTAVLMSGVQTLLRAGYNATVVRATDACGPVSITCVAVAGRITIAFVAALHIDRGIVVAVIISGVGMTVNGRRQRNVIGHRCGR